MGSISNKPTTVKPTLNEVSAGRLGERHLEKAVRSLHEDGLVVISNLVPHADLDHLNEKMVKDARTLQARGKDMPYNYNVGNIQQDAPPITKYFYESIFLNPIAAQITTAMLGPRPKWTFCSGNTALPPVEGTKPQRQPVHSDADFAHPTHPFALVVNVPLIQFTPDNGSTEVWLGTHTGDLSGLQVQEGAHGERASGRIKEDLLEKRKQVSGPMQPVIEKGSIVIRDLRLWHAGMPNWTDEVRVMLAMSESMSQLISYNIANVVSQSTLLLGTEIRCAWSSLKRSSLLSMDRICSTYQSTGSAMKWLTKSI